MKRILAILALLATSAQAYTHNGNDLLKMADSDSAVDRVHAIGYVTGTIDALSVLDVVCLPKGMTVGQVHAITIREIRASLDDRHISATSLITVMWAGKAPCQKKGTAL